MKKGQQPLIPKVTSYQQDKESLPEICSHAEEAFRHRREMYDQILAEMDNPTSEKDVSDFTDMINAAAGGDPEAIRLANTDLGQWVTDYLADNGYRPHLNSLIIKLMVLTAFPSITQEEELTPETLKDAIIRMSRVMNEYLNVQETRTYTWSKNLGQGGKPTFYS